MLYVKEFESSAQLICYTC